MPTDLPPRQPEDPRPGRLTVTSPQQIMVSVLAGAVLGYFLLLAIELVTPIPPLVPWSVPIVLVAISLPAFLYGRTIPGRIERCELAPDEGVRALVLGKSMLMTGCVLAGGHLVYVLKWIGQTDIPGPRERVIHGVVTIVVSIVFGLVGAMIEKACVVDAGDGEGGPAGGQTA